jgi:hypothetical protein
MIGPQTFNLHPFLVLHPFFSLHPIQTKVKNAVVEEKEHVAFASPKNVLHTPSAKNTIKNGVLRSLKKGT